MMLKQQARVAMGFLMVVALFGCSAPPPVTQAVVKVTDIDVGRSAGADKTIGDKTDSFRPADTFYVSVRTEGSATSATLTARWTYQDGKVIDESKQTIAPSGSAAVTEFHLAKPDGWPTGGYKVEVLLNGASAGTKDFRVS
jgi:hypothetical protein